jgi:hypothetical protein
MRPPIYHPESGHTVIEALAWNTPPGHRGAVHAARGRGRHACRTQRITAVPCARELSQGRAAELLEVLRSWIAEHG